jgi:hypothetical protein
MELKAKAAKRKHRGIYDQYRAALNRGRLTEEQIDAMRVKMQRLAEVICEHIWGKEFF